MVAAAGAAAGGVDEHLVPSSPSVATAVGRASATAKDLRKAMTTADRMPGVAPPRHRAGRARPGTHLAEDLPMTSFRAFVAASLLSLAVPACGGGQPVTMADSFDLDIFGPHVNDLHGPYVSGAEFQINVGSSASQSQAGWTLSSSDPNVVQVTSPLTGGSASVKAVRPGVTTLRVLDASGNVLDTHAAVVAIPDTVKLSAEGPLLTGASDDAAVITQAAIVEGGQATFLVRYFAQGMELYGSGALTPGGTTDIAATTASTSFASARDFLQVTPDLKATTGVVSLRVGGSVVGELPVSVVPPSALSHVSLLPQSTDAAQPGDSLVLYAHAVGTVAGQAVDVYGASFNWLIDGKPEVSAFIDGPADLFFYSYDSSVTEDVAPSYGSLTTPYAIVHGNGGSVGSTATAPLACAVYGAPGGTASPFFGVALGLVGLAFARRRTLAARRQA